MQQETYKVGDVVTLKRRFRRYSDTPIGELDKFGRPKTVRRVYREGRETVEGWVAKVGPLLLYLADVPGVHGLLPVWPAEVTAEAAQ